jgi:hypothetical protein
MAGLRVYMFEYLKQAETNQRIVDRPFKSAHHFIDTSSMG